MIFQNQNRIGLDDKIAKIQTWIYQINDVWGLVDENKKIDAYDRCFVINREGVKTVERYIDKGEYEPISVAEKNKFFFLHRSKAIKKDGINYSTEIELFFVVNLEELKPSITHYADLEVQNDVESLLSEIGGVCWIKELESGYEKVFNGISYKQKNDIHPYHVFKFTLGVNYSPNANCR